MKPKKLLLPALVLLAASLVTLIRQITAGTLPETLGQHNSGRKRAHL